MPGRPCGVAEPLPAGLAHHRDLRRIRRRHRKRKNSWASGRANGLCPRPRRDPGRRPVRMPWHAGQKRSRRQCGAERSVVGFIGGARPRRPGRAADRWPRLLPRPCRDAAAFGSHRRARGQLGNHEDCIQALSMRLRRSSRARLRHRLAARPSRRGRGKGHGHRQSAPGRAHRPAEHFNERPIASERAARGRRRAGHRQSRRRTVQRALRERSARRRAARQGRGQA
jgi:hypothetical protein